MLRVEGKASSFTGADWGERLVPQCSAVSLDFGFLLGGRFLVGGSAS